MSRYFTLLLLLFSAIAQGQEVTGKWKTIDDETGEPRSVVEIFERDGKVHGKVVKLLLRATEDPDPVCGECEASDDRYKKKVIGMEIMRDMVKNRDGSYEGGNILDPKNGRVYRCRIWLEGNDLKLRGYWGPFYRTQTWQRFQ